MMWTLYEASVTGPFFMHMKIDESLFDPMPKNWTCSNLAILTSPLWLGMISIDPVHSWKLMVKIARETAGCHFNRNAPQILYFLIFPNKRKPWHGLVEALICKIDELLTKSMIINEAARSCDGKRSTQGRPGTLSSGSQTSRLASLYVPTRKFKTDRMYLGTLW